MSAHVILHLSNELGKSDIMRGGLTRTLLRLHNKLINSIIQKRIICLFCVKKLRCCRFVRNVQSYTEPDKTSHMSCRIWRCAISYN